MRILITGANGFIGRYLKTYLSNEHELSTPTSYELDLTDTVSVNNFFKNQQFDAVIHSAVRGRNNVQDVNSKLANDIVNMFINLLNNRQHYKILINFGSGAEFGLDKSIDGFVEDDILNIVPMESYGLGKNIISRTIRGMSDFYNLRIFSCFDPSEDSNRLITKFKKISEQGAVFEIDQDRYMDFVSLQDIAIVVNAALNNELVHNDINIVYQKKLLLSDLLYTYCQIHGIDTNQFVITGTSNKHYTGNGDRLASLNLNLEGIYPTLQRYKQRKL
jgi:nucleoside-diphosphate-sugar epimerase